MMDDETRWQDATLPADSQLIGPERPEAATGDASDYDELETGIASLLAAMQTAETDEDDETGPVASGDGAPLFEDAHTLQLLGELDRLWQRPSP